jgi:hypothetical protein
LPCAEIDARQSFAVREDKNRTAKCVYRAICCRVLFAVRFGEKTHDKTFAVRFIVFAVRRGRTAIPVIPVVQGA